VAAKQLKKYNLLLRMILNVRLLWMKAQALGQPLNCYRAIQRTLA